MKASTKDSNSLKQQPKKILKQQRPKTSKPLVSSSIQKSPPVDQQNLFNGKQTVRKVQSGYNSSKLISMNDQSRAFIQSGAGLALAPAMLNNQSRALVQSSLNNRASSHTQLLQKSAIQGTPAYSNNVNDFHRSFRGKILKESHNDFLKFDDDEPIAEQTSNKAKQNEDTNVDKACRLSMKLKRKIITSSSLYSQNYTMLVSLGAETISNSYKTPVDLICVIDVSGSMKGLKINLVKEALECLLNYLGDSDRLSIIVFSKSVSRLFPLLRATPSNKKMITIFIERISACGGTDINLGLEHAFKVVKDRKYANPVTSILLLSDGLDDKALHRVHQSNTDPKLPQDLTISTFGFGSDHDPQLMTEIADLRHGNFYFVKELNTVDEAFIDCLGGLVSSIAQNVRIKIKPEQSDALHGVQIVHAYGDSSMWTQQEGTYITKMGNLMSGQQKDYVLELEIPINKRQLQDNEKNIAVASAEVKMTGFDNREVVKKAELIITLLNEEEDFDDVEDDKEVMTHFYRVKGGLVTKEAGKLADLGKYDEAKKLLMGFKEQVENSFLNQEEFIKNMIKDMNQTLQDLNPKVYKGYGRQNICANYRSQTHQTSNMNTNNRMQIPQQMIWTNELRAMKSRKPF